MKRKVVKAPRKTAATSSITSSAAGDKTKAVKAAKTAAPTPASTKAAAPAPVPTKSAAPAPVPTKAAAPAPVPTKAAAPAPAAAKPKRTTKVKPMKIPPILLEGDAPPAPAVSGPGQRYALGPTPAVAPASPAGGELPESYGTQQLFLAARDPHWLYAYWDFSREQLKKYNGLSADGHLVLRVYRGTAEGEPLSHIHLHPESRTWFAPVPAAGAKYLAELGYHDAERKWVSLALSGATFSPPDSLSDDTSIRFATIPSDVSFAELLALVKGAVREHVPLVEAMQQMRAQGHRELPTPESVQREWTPAQEKALADVISIDQVRRIWIGSLEITELIRRQILQQVSSIGSAQFSAPTSLSAALGGVSSVTSVSSPFGGAQRKRGFWFNVNAELIIYGATEPDAKVTIGERQIKLRPDGTFSFRFALPDGEYALPAAAQSADGVETRQAHLKFSRGTAYHGEVGAHPQDRNLKPPLVSAVA
jgi:hypothetical protein